MAWPGWNAAVALQHQPITTRALVDLIASLPIAGHFEVASGAGGVARIQVAMGGHARRSLCCSSSSSDTEDAAWVTRGCEWLLVNYDDDSEQTDWRRRCLSPNSCVAKQCVSIALISVRSVEETNATNLTRLLMRVPLYCYHDVACSQLLKRQYIKTNFVICNSHSHTLKPYKVLRHTMYCISGMIIFCSASVF